MYFVYKNKKYGTFRKLRKAVRANFDGSPAYVIKGNYKRIIHTKPKTSYLNFE